MSGGYQTINGDDVLLLKPMEVDEAVSTKDLAFSANVPAVQFQGTNKKRLPLIVAGGVLLVASIALLLSYSRQDPLLGDVQIYKCSSQPAIQGKFGPQCHPQYPNTKSCGVNYCCELSCTAPVECPADSGVFYRSTDNGLNVATCPDNQHLCPVQPPSDSYNIKFINGQCCDVYLGKCWNAFA